MVVASLVYSIPLVLETASAESVIKNINIGNTPIGVAFNPSNDYTYATNRDLGTVSVIDGSTNDVIKDIPVGLQPSAIVFDSHSGNMYVVNQYSKNISVIDSSTNTVVGTIPIGEDRPTAVSLRLP